MTYKQPPPFAVQVELTEGCNLRCGFCGIRGIREKRGDFKFMDIMTAERIAHAVADAGWNPRVEWAMHGEPTINPDLVDIVATFRHHLPNAQLMLTTNAQPLTERPEGFDAVVDALWEAGLNIFALDDYRGMRVADDFARPYAAKRPHLPFYDYPVQREGNPHSRRGPKFRMMTVIEDISQAKSGTHYHLGNHAGAAGPLDPSVQKVCTKPFREISFRYDGNVAICCNDWRGTFKCGNINDVGLLDIWHHPALDAMRRRLIKGQRDMAPCYGCTHLSDRVGLLPDKLGKERGTYPEPQPGDEELIKQACAGATLATPVIRKWEKV